MEEPGFEPGAARREEPTLPLQPPGVINIPGDLWSIQGKI